MMTSFQLSSIEKYIKKLGLVEVYPDVINGRYFGLPEISPNEWLVCISGKKLYIVRFIGIEKETYTIITRDSDIYADLYSNYTVTRLKNIINRIVKKARKLVYTVKQDYINDRIEALEKDFEKITD